MILDRLNIEKRSIYGGSRYEAILFITTVSKQNRMEVPGIIDAAVKAGTFRLPESAKEGMIYGGCNCGNCHLTILPAGEIYACRRVAESKVGNVFEDRIADVWVTSMKRSDQAK